MPSVPTGLVPEEVSEVETLSDDECWSFLASASIGRLAVSAGGGVDIFPVNFGIVDRAIYLRSAPGSKLIDIVRAPRVAFEADGAGRHTRWSVVVKGVAERMSSASDIEASGVLQLATMTSSAKWNYLRISPGSITGRRFVSFGASANPDATEGADGTKEGTEPS